MAFESNGQKPLNASDVLEYASGASEDILDALEDVLFSLRNFMVVEKASEDALGPRNIDYNSRSPIWVISTCARL